jgi:putative transcriptional regulator
MAKKVFDSIMRGLAEVEAHKKGQIKLKSRLVQVEPIPVYDARQVKLLRQHLALPQTTFASICGVSYKTVEAWESGRNIPNGSACRLFEIIQKDPSVLKREGILVVS